MYFISFRGARHGLRATGKLARIAQQEAQLLSQSKYSGYSHFKKLNEEVDNINFHSDTDSTEIKKKKKKKRNRCYSNEKSDTSINKCELAESDEPLPDKSQMTDEDNVASVENVEKVSRKSKRSKDEENQDVEASPEINVPKPKKKKKKENVEDDLPENGNTNSADGEVSSESANKKKSKKKKNKDNMELE